MSKDREKGKKGVKKWCSEISMLLEGKGGRTGTQVKEPWQATEGGKSGGRWDRYSLLVGSAKKKGLK